MFTGHAPVDFDLPKRRIACSGTTFCSSVRELWMSWHFSRALVEEYSGDIFLGGDAFAQSNTSHSKVVFSCSDRMTAFCQRSPSGMMCEHLTEEDGEALLTLFLVASLAKTSAQQAGRIERD